MTYITERFLQLPLLSQAVLIYAVFINIITFFYFGIDKIKSQMGRWRVSEKTLWILTLIGGSIGALTGMHFFRHKTKKLSFQAMIAIIVVAHLAILVLFTSY